MRAQRSPPALLFRDTIELRRSRAPIAYPYALAQMQARQLAVWRGQARPLIWLLEHPPLITSGPRARAQDLLAPKRFAQFLTPRGGEHTYHGPGQRVVYLILNLAQFQKDVRAYVQRLQGVIAATLRRCGLSPLAQSPAIGVWVNRPRAPAAKIAAIGIHLRHWVSAHGFALNVAPNLEHYKAIVPCGRADDITSLSAMGCALSMAQVDRILLDELALMLTQWGRG